MEFLNQKKGFLGYDANQNLDTITLPIRPDRTQWFNDLAYTEWTIDEISEGLPLKHLTF